MLDFENKNFSKINLSLINFNIINNIKGVKYI